MHLRCCRVPVCEFQTQLQFRPPASIRALASITQLLLGLPDSIRAPASIWARPLYGHIWYLNTRGRRTSYPLQLCLSDCHWHNICPSHLYTSPRTRLGPVGTLHCVLGVRKKIRGKNKNKMKRTMGLQHSAMLISNVYSRLALASLLSIIHWKKPIYDLQVFGQFWQSTLIH